MEPDEYHAMRAAEDRHWWYVGLHDLVIHSVQGEAAELRRPLDILDAGCGTGRLCELMQPFGAVTGCDTHPLALEATAERGISRVRRCDLAVDDLEAESYDLITFIDVLYHRAVADENAVLRNLRRGLKKGGLLVMQVAAFEWLRGAHDLAVHTRRRYRRGEVVRLLQGVGFTVEFATYRLLPWFLPALLWRCFTRLCPPRSSDDKPLSDVASPVSPLLNQLLAACVKTENRLLCAGVRLPLGTSVFALARK
ncbi:MAG: methyltransferase domain-containing protein [Verrucomicrobia bacterium]|nr:methyltransferase domain-containing protein [Verrucomicrobiota bacterium]